MTFMTPEPYRPIIRTQTDLERAWRSLMGPLGFSSHTVWLMFIGLDDRPVPQLIPLEDSAWPPADADIAGFDYLLQQVAVEYDGGIRVAMLLSRPGRDRGMRADREWAARLYGACRKARLACEIIHLATDTVLIPLPMDDVAVALSA